MRGDTGDADSREYIHAQVVEKPCWRSAIILVAATNTHAVLRTVDGLLGVGKIVGVEGCYIDEFGHAARRRHVGLGKARGAIGIVAYMTM